MPTTASPRPRWKTASARGTSSHGRHHSRPAAVRHGRIRRRRQVDARRSAPARHEVGAGRHARVGGAGQPGEGSGRRRPGPAHRRAARRARAGHHHRCRLPLLRDVDPLVRPCRHPGTRRVHAQHGHGGVHGRARARAGRCAARHRRADPSARRCRCAAGRPPPRARREQDGPRRVRRVGVRGPPRRVRRRGRLARCRRRRRDPVVSARGRQRRRAVDPHAVVRRPDPARAPRGGAGRQRPVARAAAVPGAVRPSAADRRAPRPSRVRRSGRARRRPGRRPGRGAADAAVRPPSRRSTGSTGRSMSPSPRSPCRCDWATTSTCPAAT